MAEENETRAAVSAVDDSITCAVVSVPSYRGSAVLLLFVAWLLTGCQREMTDGRTALETLGDAAGRSDTRIVQLRLHGHEFKPYAARNVPELRATARSALRVLSGRSDKASLHASAVAALLVGDVPLALDRFRMAVATSPHSSPLWNDYAVACAAAADADTSRLIDGLAAVDHSLRLAPSAEAAYNRAVILERLGLLDAAADARDALAPNSDWTIDLRHRQKPGPWTRRWNDDNLRAEADAGNTEGVSRIVAAYPQETRSSTETIYLAEWAQAQKQSDASRARRALNLAALIADALRRRSGETLARDAVAAVRRAQSSVTETVLADAQLDYVAARKSYLARNVHDAQRQFRSAREGFAAAHSPMALVADYYLASCLHDFRDERALATLQSLLRRLPEGYRALRAQVHWEIGTDLSRAGRLHDALAMHQSAAAQFEALGETRHRLTTESLAAATEIVLGRRAQAWEAQTRIFRGLSESGDRGALQRALDIAARAEAMTDEWENAHALLTIAADSKLAINPIIHASTLRWRALAGRRIGLPSAGARLIGARRAAEVIPDERLRSQALAEVAFAEASLATQTAPTKALPLMDAFISRSKSDHDLLLLPEALLERALLRRALGSEDGAISDLQAATRIMQVRRRTMPANDLRDAYFRTADRVARELADLLSRRGDAAAALAAVDRLRSEPYRRTGVDVPASDATCLVYVSLPDALLIFTSEAGQVRSVRVPVSQRVLQDEVARYTPSSESRKIAAWVLGPVDAAVRRASRLVIVPDHDLAGIPFSALRLPSTGRRLVEHVEITMSPSIAVASSRGTFDNRFRRAVVVGNPAFDARLFADFPTLPGAEREARLVASRYPDATLLTGAAATKQRFLAAIEHADLLHLAAHAGTVPRDPKRSHLMLAASSADHGVVYLSEIEQRVSRLELAVLVGCRTATPAPNRRNIDNVALGFLAAGANNVAGTLWDVDDQTARKFALLLHDRIREGNSPAAALRLAQLAMTQSPVAREREPLAWAAFQMYGAVRQQKEEH